MIFKHSLYIHNVNRQLNNDSKANLSPNLNLLGLLSLTEILNYFIILVFNLGEYRRHKTTAYKNHDFFRPDNAEAMVIRTQCAIEALKDVCDWLNNGGEVAVFDATNSTLERRKLIREYVVDKMGFKLFFVESVS